jgi:hypothetical protein
LAESFIETGTKIVGVKQSRFSSVPLDGPTFKGLGYLAWGEDPIMIRIEGIKEPRSYKIARSHCRGTVAGSATESASLNFCRFDGGPLIGRKIEGDIPNPRQIEEISSSFGSGCVARETRCKGKAEENGAKKHAVLT